MIKTGFTRCRGRISPVLDEATELMIFRCRPGMDVKDISEPETLDISTDHPFEKVNILIREGIKCLICGAVSRPLSQMIIDAGITLKPFISGNIEDVLVAHVNSALEESDLRMPGCRGRHYRQGNCGRKGFGNRGHSAGISGSGGSGDNCAGKKGAGRKGPGRNRRDFYK